MKRTLTIAFIPLYLLLTGGVTVLVHTCGTYTTVTAMPLTSEDPCGCDGGESDACCSSEVKEFSISDAQKTAASAEKLTLGVSEVLLLNSALLPPPGEERSIATSVAPSPPERVPATILHCSFLI